MSNQWVSLNFTTMLVNVESQPFDCDAYHEIIHLIGSKDFGLNAHQITSIKSIAN
jgi:hypothetical protein